MRFTYVAPIVVIAATSTIAIADQLAVPSGYPSATFEGWKSPLNGDARTLQTAYPASELASIPVGAHITGITWRLHFSEQTWPIQDATWEHYDIRLSTPANAPGNLSLVFAENVGANETLVRSGSLTIPANTFAGTISTPGGAPNDFGYTISFDTPYIYDGNDLLVEIRHTGHGGTSSPFLDFAFDYGGSNSVYQVKDLSYTSQGGPGTAAFGYPGPVIAQLTWVVPSPSSITIAGMFAGLAAVRRRR
ncbi:MAG: hypothetical protein H6815_02360 [Phycisphaeraceae bacterium]|nr:hypothetical protein [Phycisphaerales bacterium]MCB9859270.1 hypothetical protein [Phycisphaeraceae bacterium]